MYSVACGEVVGVISDHRDIQEILVQLENKSGPEKAYNYPGLYRRVAVGDRITVNTTAVNLGLGTGGRHFVIPEGQFDEHQGGGHIMKLRYTPWQFSVLAAEEEDSPYHQRLSESFSLGGTPVVAAPLHSMLPGIILGFRAFVNFAPKVVYVMTDGAALPAALSDLVRTLKGKKLLEAVITAGHAFGGDLEAVSIPSAMLIAREVVGADLIIVAMGPGIVGTGTTLGFSGVEQSWVIDLAARLEGVPVSVPRISGADPRERHRGISHHSLTILTLANQPALLGISRLIPGELVDNIFERLQERDLLSRHRWFWTGEPPAEGLFNEYNLQVKSMGRDLRQEPWFFQSSVAAGFLAAAVRNKNLAGLPKFTR